LYISALASKSSGVAARPPATSTWSFWSSETARQYPPVCNLSVFTDNLPEYRPVRRPLEHVPSWFGRHREAGSGDFAYVSDLSSLRQLSRSGRQPPGIWFTYASRHSRAAILALGWDRGSRVRWVPGSLGRSAGTLSTVAIRHRGRGNGGLEGRTGSGLRGDGEAVGGFGACQMRTGAGTNAGGPHSYRTAG
jgi:hypothetical protein